MITLFNNTPNSFRYIRAGKTTKSNEKVTIGYGRMNFNVFLEEDAVKSLTSYAVKTDSKFRSIDANVILYFNNLNYRPIAVGSHHKNNANLLILAHKLNDSERIIRVEQDGTLGLEKGFEKGKYLSAVVSFRTDRDSEMRIITLDGENIHTTTYKCHDGFIERTVVTTNAKDFTKYDLSKRGTITPYRPKRPTHLIFTLDHKDSVANELFDAHNYTLVKFKSIKELKEKIASYKKVGFTAASLFVSVKRNEQLNPLEEPAKNIIIDEFRTAHLVYEDTYTVPVSKKPQMSKRPSKPKRNTNNIKKNK